MNQQTSIFEKVGNRDIFYIEKMFSYFKFTNLTSAMKTFGINVCLFNKESIYDKKIANIPAFAYMNSMLEHTNNHSWDKKMLYIYLNTDKKLNFEEKRKIYAFFTTKFLLSYRFSDETIFDPLLSLKELDTLRDDEKYLIDKLLNAPKTYVIQDV